MPSIPHAYGTGAVKSREECDGVVGEDVEQYEEEPGDMDGLGWNGIWRRGEALAGGGGGRGGGDGGPPGTRSGLDFDLNSLAEKVHFPPSSPSPKRDRA